jgi:hypothetical protein
MNFSSSRTNSGSPIFGRTSFARSIDCASADVKPRLERLGFSDNVSRGSGISVLGNHILGNEIRHFIFRHVLTGSPEVS